jgi:hypothetical protein
MVGKQIKRESPNAIVVVVVVVVVLVVVMIVVELC